MTQQDTDRFAELMGALAELTRQSISTALVALYFRVLADVPIEAVEAGIATVMRTHKIATLPLPGEIRDAILGTADDRAVLAWGDAQRAMSRVGRYRDPRGYIDEVTHDALVVAFGSWQAACDQSIEGADGGFVARRFQQAYAAAARRDAVGDVKQLTRGEATKWLADITAKCGPVAIRKMDA